MEPRTWRRGSPPVPAVCQGSRPAQHAARWVCGLLGGNPPAAGGQRPSTIVNMTVSRQLKAGCSGPGPGAPADRRAHAPLRPLRTGRETPSVVVVLLLCGGRICQSRRSFADREDWSAHWRAGALPSCLHSLSLIASINQQARGKNGQLQASCRATRATRARHFPSAGGPHPPAWGEPAPGAHHSRPPTTGYLKPSRCPKWHLRAGSWLHGLRGGDCNPDWGMCCSATTARWGGGSEAAAARGEGGAVVGVSVAPGLVFGWWAPQ